MKYTEDDLDRMTNPVIRESFSNKNKSLLVNERPGRRYKVQKRYMSGSEHFGKGRTLRNKRRYNFKSLFRKLEECI